MIPDEIRNGIKTESDIHEIKKSIETGIIRGKNTRIKREKLQSPREAYDHTNT